MFLYFILIHSDHHKEYEVMKLRIFQNISLSQFYMCQARQRLNSHFLGISTATGYLFLLTASVLYIKPLVPPHVSWIGHNQRHNPIPWHHLLRGKSAHKQTPACVPSSLTNTAQWWPMNSWRLMIGEGGERGVNSVERWEMWCCGAPNDRCTDVSMACLVFVGELMVRP